jgi:hypothetical protein
MCTHLFPVAERSSLTTISTPLCIFLLLEEVLEVVMIRVVEGVQGRYYSLAVIRYLLRIPLHSLLEEVDQVAQTTVPTEQWAEIPQWFSQPILPITRLRTVGLVGLPILNLPLPTAPKPLDREVVNLTVVALNLLLMRQVLTMVALMLWDLVVVEVVQRVEIELGVMEQFQLYLELAVFTHLPTGVVAVEMVVSMVLDPLLLLETEVLVDLAVEGAPVPL